MYADTLFYFDADAAARLRHADAAIIDDMFSRHAAIRFAFD